MRGVKITKNYKILVLLGLNTVYFFVRVANLLSLSCKLPKLNVGLHVFPTTVSHFDTQLLEFVEHSALWCLLPQLRYTLEVTLICHVDRLFSIQSLLNTEMKK